MDENGKAAHDPWHEETRVRLPAAELIAATRQAPASLGPPTPFVAFTPASLASPTTRPAFHPPPLPPEEEESPHSLLGSTCVIDPELLESTRKLAREATETARYEELDVTRDVTPQRHGSVPSRSSHSRLRTSSVPSGGVVVSPSVWPSGSVSGDTARYLADLSRAHRELGVDVRLLRERASTLIGGGLLLDEALTALNQHGEALNALRGALSKIYFCATDARMATLVGSGTNFGAYVKGLFEAARAVHATLDELANGIAERAPSAPLFIAGMQGAAKLHFACLAPQVRLEIVARCSEFAEPADPLSHLVENLDELASIARWLQ